MHTTVNDYHVRIVDEKNRINELIEECTYDIQGVTHIDMNEFVEKILEESMAKQLEAMYSDLPPYDYVMQHFGVDGMSTEDKKTLIKELLGVKND